uniref:SDR family oxidoreductase n=1 Tax=Stenotrophomonas maltophilia TaxID=40324 RepID=UPI003D1878BC
DRDQCSENFNNVQGNVMLLRGRTAVISGAASLRGIGLATARAYAAHGARVAILDLDETAAKAAAAGLGPDHIGVA